MTTTHLHCHCYLAVDSFGWHLHFHLLTPFLYWDIPFHMGLFSILRIGPFSCSKVGIQTPWQVLGIKFQLYGHRWIYYIYQFYLIFLFLSFVKASCLTFHKLKVYFGPKLWFGFIYFILFYWGREALVSKFILSPYFLDIFSPLYNTEKI